MIIAPKYWQGGRPWGKELIAPGVTFAGNGCVATTAAILISMITGKTVTPMDVLTRLRETPGALVDGKGKAPGSLMVWPVLLATYGLVCDEAIAAAPDHSNALHEFAGHQVDANADLAGATAAALVDGFAALRLDIDGDGKGDHTVALVGQEGDAFMISDPALSDIIPLDANLENADIHWGAKPHPYRVVGVRAVRRPAA